MNSGMTILNQSIETEQNCVTRTLIALLFTFFTEDFFEDISDDVERWFDESNYDECNSAKNDKRPLPIGMNKKVIGLFKNEL